MEGKGLLFRVGGLILEAGVPKNLIEKIVTVNRNVLLSFTILYALECLNSLNLVTPFTKKLILYFEK